MRLVKKLRQHRRDFVGIYECENCGEEAEVPTGYDDRNFHDNVIPALKCQVCGESTHTLGELPQYVQTKYGAEEVV